MKIKELNKIFLERCRSFSQKSDAFDFETYEAKTYTVCSVVLRVIQLQFVYVRKASTLIPQSTLFCRIFLNKNEPFFMHIPELFAYSETDDFRQCYFPYIESEARMNASFDALEQTIQEYLTLFERMGAESTHWNDVHFVTLNKEYKYVFDKATESISELDDREIGVYIKMLANHEEFSILPDFTNLGSGWFSFLNGDFDAAARYYEKRIERGQASLYDERLYRFICDNKNAAYTVNRELFAAADFKKCSKNAIHYIFSYLPSYLLTAGASILLYFILHLAVSVGCEAVIDFGFGVYLIFAALPALFLSVILRRKLARLFGIKNVRMYLDFDDITAGASSALSKAAFCVSAAALAAAVVIFTVFSSVRVYDDRFVCDLDADFQFEEYYYSDVKSIYHIDGRYNPDDDIVNRGSYVFVFSDGEAVDLDVITSEKKTESILFARMNVDTDRIIRVATDRDLPRDIQEKLNAYQ